MCIISYGVCSACVYAALKAQLHGSQFWRQLFLKSASRFQYSNLIGCVHANYDVIVKILGVRYLENRRTRFRATAPLILLCVPYVYVCVNPAVAITIR